MSCQFVQAGPWESVAPEVRDALSVSGQRGGVRMTLHVTEFASLLADPRVIEASIWLTPDDAHALAHELLLLEAEARGVGGERN